MPYIPVANRLVKVCKSLFVFSLKMSTFPIKSRFSHTQRLKNAPIFFLYIRIFFNIIFSFHYRLIVIKSMLLNLQYLWFKNPASKEFAFSFERKIKPIKKKKRVLGCMETAICLKKKGVFSLMQAMLIPIPSNSLFLFSQANILFQIFLLSLKCLQTLILLGFCTFAFE